MINSKFILFVVAALFFIGCSKDDNATEVSFPELYSLTDIENQDAQTFVVQANSFDEIDLDGTWLEADSVLNASLVIPNAFFSIVEIELLNTTDIRMEIDTSFAPGSDPTIMGTYNIVGTELIATYDNTDLTFEYLPGEGQINYCLFSSVYSKFDSTTNMTNIGPSNITDCIYDDQTAALNDIKNQNNLNVGDTILIKTSNVVFLE